MTIEELLNLPTSDIRDMSRQQIEDHVRCYFPLTRPSDLSPLPTESKMDPEIEAAVAALTKKTNLLDKLKTQ